MRKKSPSDKKCEGALLNSVSGSRNRLVHVLLPVVSQPGNHVFNTATVVPSNRVLQALATAPIGEYQLLLLNCSVLMSERQLLSSYFPFLFERDFPFRD